MAMASFLRFAWVLTVLLAATSAPLVHADEVGCTSTTVRLFSPNDKVCVQAFDDPRVTGITCHISQARTGGWKGAALIYVAVSRRVLEGSPMNAISAVPIMPWRPR